jgi:hypothetical protein
MDTNTIGFLMLSTGAIALLHLKSVDIIDPWYSESDYHAFMTPSWSRLYTGQVMTQPKEKCIRMT